MSKGRQTLLACALVPALLLPGCAGQNLQSRDEKPQTAANISQDGQPPQAGESRKQQPERKQPAAHPTETGVGQPDEEGPQTGQPHAGSPNSDLPAAETLQPEQTGPTSDRPAPATADTQQLAVYHGPVEHIFFHPLIAYPTLAFDGDAMDKGYRDWFVTVTEFERIVESLYRNQYILIDIRDLYEERVENGRRKLVKKELRLPKNKKPLIISIDDMNYYDYMRKNGNVYKLVLDRDGNVAAYSRTPEGKETIAYDNEIVPILDAFVRKHPDFSFRGAKGMIALTGYEGVLGYRTQDAASPRYESEKREALKVIARLKETGWSFASHGYGHRDAQRISYKSLAEDTLRWKREVEPLTGPTPVYVYPYGSRVETNGDKYTFLVRSGFTVLCGVGPAPYLKYTGEAVMMDRRHIDGIALEQQGERLAHMFDSRQVIDGQRYRMAAKKRVSTLSRPTPDRRPPARDGSLSASPAAPTDGECTQRRRFPANAPVRE
jgi:Polysaccharide deacetylase